MRLAALAAAGIAGVTIRAANLPPGISEQPLALHPHPRAKTMFTLLAPEETGIKVQNAYDDPRIWGERFHEFSSGSIGTGVAIADYDGDGRPDLYVVSKMEGCRLFRNLGGYRFEDVTARAGVGATPGIWNQGASFVDVNNDGLVDLYVCRFNAPNLLYINQGDGTFRESAHAHGLDVTDASVVAAFCDYDRDGRLDVYIACNLLNATTQPYGRRGYLFHQNGEGTFTNVTDAAGIGGESQSHSATWWDFDGDGWPDLYVANDFGRPDKLYHNNRDGTFSDAIDQTVPHTSYSSMGSDLGDVNNDGLEDLIVSEMATTTHAADQRGPAIDRARMADLAEGSPAAPQLRRNALFVNTGTGRCVEAAYLAGLAATDWTWSVRLEDLDNDGRVDLFATNGMYRDAYGINGRLDAAESQADRIRIMRNGPVLAQTHLAYRNLGDLRFENVSAAWGLDQKGVSFGAALGDLSGDGNLDIAYTNYAGGLTLLRNDCDSGHVVNVELRGTTSNRFGVGSVVRIESQLGVQVRTLTLARGYLSSSEPMLHFGLGSVTEIRRMTVTWPSGRRQVFENLPVDRRYTITEPAVGMAAPAPDAPRVVFAEAGARLGLNLPSREEVVDETDAQRLLPRRLNRRGPAIAVGDVDGNGTDSVVMGGTTVDALRVLKRGADGSYRAARSPEDAPVAVDDGPVLLFDSRGTGRLDLLVTRGGNALPEGAPEYQPRLYWNDGHGGFRPAADDVLPPLPLNVGAVAAADFEHTGALGLFLGGRVATGRYPHAPKSALLVNRGGRFEDVTDRVAPALRNVGMVSSALWTDVDSDGWPDLVLALEWGNVRYFHNHHGRSLEDWTEKAGFASAGVGWWTSIAAGDFNGDGRIDYVVGNVGLNTPYHADPAHPALLFAGKFAEGRGEQLIEAYYEGDRLYPWRTRHELGAAMPVVLRRFPRNDNYARATLAEIVGADKVAQADKFAATELRSGVFLSRPDGTYQFEPLPNIAQIAPLQGMVVGDFLGEGHLGICVVQNSFAPIPSVGRFDGGLGQWLRGGGHGNFDPVPARESGLIVPGDAKALALADLDGSGLPGFVVSRNANTLQAFTTRGSAGHHYLRVGLQGRPGNPTAIGARITVQLADGSSETAEVCAGSGYYSQSTGACFFGYSDSAPAVLVRVRWPLGAESETKVGVGNTLTITEPSAATAR